MTDRPIIGFDAKRIVSNGTGLGSYGRTLVNDLARFPLQMRLYTPTEGRSELRAQVSSEETVSFIQGSPQFHRGKLPLAGIRNAIWRSYGIVKDLQHDGVQLYHGLSGELPFGIRKSGIKSVVTIHDLIFLRHPEFYHWIDTKIYAWKFRQTIREADHIIAISECTKRDIMEYGQVSEDKISLIYQSCAPRFTEGDRHLVQSAGDCTKCLSPSVKRYILSVGSIEERKNILLAVKALPYLPEDLHLVIVGRHTKYTDRVLEYAEAHQLTPRVHVLHGVSDEELPALYANAEAFVYPSRYEGFGIPIIEAIYSGLPVVACTGSCLEEAGGPDSIYVSPNDAEGMAHAINMVLKGAENREERILRSREYVKRFKGTDVASQVVDIYHQLLTK